MEFSCPWAMPAPNAYWMPPGTAAPTSADGAIQFGSFPGMQTQMEVPAPPYGAPQPGMGVGYGGVGGQIPTPYYQTQQPGGHPPRPTNRRGSGGPRRPQPAGPPASGPQYNDHVRGPPQGPGQASYYPYGGMPYGPPYVEAQQWGPGWGPERTSARIPLEASGQNAPPPRPPSSGTSEPEQPWSPASSASTASRNREKKAIPLIDPRSNKAITGDKGESAQVTKAISYKDAVGRKSKSAAPAAGDGGAQEKPSGQKLNRSHSGETKVIHSMRPAPSRGGLMASPQQAPGAKMGHPVARGQGSAPTAPPAQTSAPYKPGAPGARLVVSEHKPGQSGLHRMPASEVGKATKKGRPLGVVATSFVQTQASTAKAVGPSEESVRGRGHQASQPKAKDARGGVGLFQQEAPKTADRALSTLSQEPAAKAAQALGPQTAFLVNGAPSGKAEDSRSRSLPAKGDPPAKEESSGAKPKWAASKKGWSAIQPRPAGKVQQPPPAAVVQHAQVQGAPLKQQATDAALTGKGGPRTKELESGQQVVDAARIIEGGVGTKGPGSAQQAVDAVQLAEDGRQTKAPDSAPDATSPQQAPPATLAQSFAAQDGAVAVSESHTATETPSLEESPEVQQAAGAATQGDIVTTETAPESLDAHEAVEHSPPPTDATEAGATSPKDVKAEIIKASQPPASSEQKSGAPLECVKDGIDEALQSPVSSEWKTHAPTVEDAVVVPSARLVAGEDAPKPASTSCDESRVEREEPAASVDAPVLEGSDVAADASGGAVPPLPTSPADPSEVEVTGKVATPPTMNPAESPLAEVTGRVATLASVEPAVDECVATEVADGVPSPCAAQPAVGLPQVASPATSEPSSSRAGGDKSKEVNEENAGNQRRCYPMDVLKGMRAINVRMPDGFEKGPWSAGDEGFLAPRRSSSLKSVARSLSFSSNSGDQPKRDWRPAPGPSRTRSGMRIDDAEIDHKRSGKRVYRFDALLELKASCVEKPPEIALGQFLKDAVAPTRTARSGDRWGARGSSRDLGGDRDRDRERARERDRERDLPSRSSGGLWAKDAAQGRASSGRSYRSRAGMDRPKGIEDDRWGKAPMPQSPFGTPQSQLHKAENRYLVGRTTSDDPGEEKRQKAFKSILNKLTPDNFQKMFAQMKEVEIASAQTLTGLIDQIFDKALIETTFCALYASLCKLLSLEMPEFEAEGDTRKVTFRRLLLNKCQGEFEKGDAAMRAAEQAEAKEVGTEEDRKILIQAKKERMRSLGNMQFIGHLFKEGMLTEKIIHQCIVELLREEKNPKPEDIECLCKLVATVGQRLTQRSDLKAYFVRVGRLAESVNLDVRHRFMLLDLIEMKQRGWVERRRQEGPKTIDEIHKEAAKEQMAIRDRGRGGGGHWGSSRSARHLEDRSGGGLWGRSGPPPSQGRPGPSPTPPLMRGEEVRPLTRIRSLGRTDSQEISLRPAGPAGRLQQRESPSFNQGLVTVPREPARERPVLNLAPPSRKSMQQAEEAPPAMTEETLGRKVKGLLEEYYNDLDNIAEAQRCIEDLKTAGALMPAVLSTSVEQALNIRGVDAAKRLLPLADLVIALCQSDGATPVVSSADMEKGAEAILHKIPDMAEDFPKAPKLVGNLMGILVSQDIVSLQKLGCLILDGGEPGEESPLVECGLAREVVVEVMKQLEEGKEVAGMQRLRDWLASDSGSM